MKTMNRRETSGGQAIVLVTLALFAMCGMMGLAVDMGWSFFVHKQAQTAADTAALGAAQEAYRRLGGGGAAVSAFDCSATGTGANQVDCQTTVINCASVVATSNLNNGCQYALKNGFDWTTSRQSVTVQSNDGLTGNRPPTAPGVLNLAYWVTARTVQTIPQLFSAVMGKTEGTVSAVATAAIAGSVGPGDFYGMNRAGDCTNSDGGSQKGQHCGADLITSPGKGGNDCPTYAGVVQGQVCAPAGIALSSSCSSTKAGFCDDGVAGDGYGAGVAGGSLTIMTGGAVTGDYHNMQNKALTPTFEGSSSTTFDDFYKGTQQPPLQAAINGPIGSCGYLGGNIPASVTLGPYQYYSYKVQGGVNVPDGLPITVGDAVTFSPTPSGICPGGGVYTPGASQSGPSANFPSYILWGGLKTSQTATFGAGQYVMAGVCTACPNADPLAPVFSVGGAVSGNGQTSITGDSSTGTAFIFTDGNYPGLAAQKGNIPSGQLLDSSGNNTTLYQGTLTFKNSTINLTGMVNSNNSGSQLPPALNVYSGIAWWQDRRNSYAAGYDEAPGSPGCPDCTAANNSSDDGRVFYCVTGGDCLIPDTSKLNAMKAANHVTPSSAGVTLKPGNVNMNMAGAFYQPRGAWIEVVAGQGTLGGPLQVVTGALILDQGNTSMLLSGPANPILKYKTVLIH